MNTNKNYFGKAALGLLLTFSFSLIILNGFSQTQAPQSFSYQAVVRDAQGNILQNQSVAFRFSILENSATGNVVYAETQSATTNNLGLVVLSIGNGSVLQGIFSTIQWGSALHFLKVELDVNGSSNFVDMGTTQLLSVPYALYSENAGNVQTYTAGNGIDVTGTTITNTAPDQTITLTGQGATAVSGTYPNFIISSTDSNTTYTAGAGLTLTGTEFSHNAHTGDVSGTTALTVTGIQDKPVSTTAPIANQVLQYNGTNWSPTQPSNLITAGNGLNYSGNTLNTVWTQNGNNIFNNNAGRVGIGMNAPTGKLTVQGDTSNVLFEVKDKDGLPVFVVYQDSVQVFVSNSSAKANKGCFAVNPKAQQKSGSGAMFRVTPDSLVEIRDRNGLPVFKAFEDSVQVFVNESSNKANKGCFAVNPKAQQKAITKNYLRVAPDSSRIYTENTIAGFGVRDISSGTATSYMQMTPNNYFIGHQAGINITSGNYNSFIGYQNGFHNTTGYKNYFIGYRAGYNNLSGYSNVFIGDSAGFNNTVGYKNIVIGNQSGFSNVAGNFNVFLGYNAGYANTANYNVFLGYEAGKNNTSGTTNSFVGYQAGYSNTIGQKNVANGYQSLYSNTTGNFNTAIGNKALYLNVSGSNNTATGSYSLNSNNSGSGNIAYGAFSLQNNTSGGGNSACGYYALMSNTIGTDNTAIGNSALLFNNNGNYNSALGSYALRSNTSGNRNIANGYDALFSNTTGNSNIAIGVEALYTANTSSENIAVGYQTLYQNTTGYNNVASGNSALYNNKVGHDNVAIGYYAGKGASNIDFTQCTFVGSFSYPTTARTNVTLLGAGISDAQCTADNQVLLGSTSVSQIRAQVSSITAYSDARMKFNVKDDVKGLDFIMKLKPVTYNEDPAVLHKIWGTPDSLLKNIDHSQIKQQRFIGFLAQDVEKAAKESGFDFPGIEVPKNDKEVYSLRYVDFIMPIIKGMQEQQKMINELMLDNEKLKSENAELTSKTQEIDNLKAEIEKIKSQMNASVIK